MTYVRSTRRDAVPTHQSDASLTQANPVQNTWYTVLNTTSDVEIYTIVVTVETTGETIEGQLTVDGNVFLSNSQVAVADTDYVLAFDVDTADKMSFTTTNYLVGVYAPLKAKSAKIEVRKTTNAGNGNLLAVVKYAKYP